MFMKNSWKKALAAFAGASILMSVSLNYVEAAAMTNSNQRVAKKIVQTAGRERLGDFAPDFARYNDDILFGEVWSKNDGKSGRRTTCFPCTTAVSLPFPAW